MTADNLLILGIVLIVASIALGLIAYAFVLNRREAEKPEGEAAPSASSEPEPAAEPETSRREAAPPAPAPAPTPARPPMPATPPAPLPSSPPPPPSASAARPPATPVAVVMREDASGRFFLRMGERELRRPEDVREARDRSLLDGVLIELNKLAARPQPTAGKPVAAEGYVETPSRPLSMVEQINNIVERKLADLPGTQRAVRLVEGAAGAVRVYVGVDRYDTIDDVPDAEVRRVIREAVAEWEARV
jgi:type IV secretory pathway VirB10-like protein